MRTWLDCVNNPNSYELINGRYEYALKINEQADKVCRLEDVYNESESEEDQIIFEKAADEFYSMRDCFNEW